MAWIKRRRAWARDHREAWQGAKEPLPDGFSLFQLQCEAAVTNALASRGRSLRERAIHNGGADKFVSARISDTPLEVWIYADQVNLGGQGVDKRFEEWDALTPAELIENFCRTMLEHLPR